MPESNDNIVVTATDDEQIDLASATNGDDEYFARLEVLDPNSRQYHEELEAAARQHAASQDPYRQALERHQQALPQLIPLYESARAAVAEARTIDEARKIRDVVDALRAYARQANDAEIETMIAEIKLRARRRIGELSHGLEKGGGPGRGKRLPSAEKSFKTAKLKAAGISSSVANRCEKLASIAEEEFERHIARARERHQSVALRTCYAPW